MHIVHLTPPGRFPTVIHDPGLWWDTLHRGAHRLERFSVNYHWWRSVCSARFNHALWGHLPLLDRWHAKLAWQSKGIAVSAQGGAAGRALDALRSDRVYASRESYAENLRPLALYLDTVNKVQKEFEFRIDVGPQLIDFDYTDSRSIADTVRQDTILYRSVVESLRAFPTAADIITVSVTTPEDLLTALMACRALRGIVPRAHICLADHGYENFSLHMYIDALRESCVFDEFFDSVVVSKDDRDDILPALVARLAQKDSVPRYLTRDALGLGMPSPEPAPGPAPLAPIFAPEAILWTRLSKRRCYWSRCTYCTQNSKYANERAPTRAEILKTLDRLEGFVKQGCRHFIFSDEALSPSTLKLLAREIQARDLRFHWACRCKLEKAHDAELFAQLGRSGCYEILYGLETTSDRILKMMDKYVEDLDEPRLAEVFREMEHAGIGVHVNLIGGYPGDTAAETRHSAEFIAEQLSQLHNATYVLNSFALLPDTPMARTPHDFGILRVGASGDVAQELDFELEPGIAKATEEAAKEIPALRDLMDEKLGWRDFAQGPAQGLAQTLYFGSGHGSIFKASRRNPFANPLLESEH